MHSNVFRPRFIRLPYLLLSLGAFCFCMALIEYLLSQTTSKDIESNLSAAGLVHATRKRNIDRRLNHDFGFDFDSGVLQKQPVQMTRQTPKIADSVFATHEAKPYRSGIDEQFQSEAFVPLIETSTSYPYAQEGPKTQSTNTFTNESWLTRYPSIMSPRDLATTTTNTSTITCTLMCIYGEATTTIERTTVTSTVSLSRGETDVARWEYWRASNTQPSASEPQPIQKRDDWSTMLDQTVTTTTTATVTDLNGAIDEQELIISSVTTCQQNCPTVVVPGVSTVTETTKIGGPIHVLMTLTVQAVVTIYKRDFAYAGLELISVTGFSTLPTRVANTEQTTPTAASSIVNPSSLARTTDQADPIWNANRDPRANFDFDIESQSLRDSTPITMPYKTLLTAGPIAVLPKLILGPSNTAELVQHDISDLPMNSLTTCSYTHHHTSSLPTGDTSEYGLTMLSSLSSNSMLPILANTSTSTCTRNCTVEERWTTISITTATHTVLAFTDARYFPKRSDTSEGTVTEIGYSTTTDLDGRVVENQIIHVKQTECLGGCPTTVVPGVSTVTQWSTVSGPRSTLMVKTVQATVTVTPAKREISYTSSDMNAAFKASSLLSIATERANTTTSIRSPLKQSEFTITTTWTGLAHTTDSVGKTSEFLAVHISTVTLTSAPTATPNSTEETSSIKYSLLSSEVVVRGEMSLFAYFLAMFAGPILFMAIRAIIEPTVASLKIIEPFRNLSSVKSGTYCAPLTTQYLSSSLSLHSLKQLRDGHVTAFWSVLMHIVITVATPLISAAMTVRARSSCIVNGGWAPCNPGWVINMPMMRSVEALILISCVLSITIIVATRRLHLRCLDPSSIISIACLMNQKNFNHKIRELDGDLNDNEFNDILSFLPVRLGRHQTTPLDRYGLILDLAQDSEKNSSHVEDKTRSKAFHSILSSQQPARRLVSRLNPLRRMGMSQDIFQDIIHLLSSLALFILVLTYYLNDRDDSFNAFFNSTEWPPRMLLVGLATLSDALMKDLERVVRITEPYRRLTLQASPETTILMPLSGTCWSNLPRCLYYASSCKDSRVGWQIIVSIIAILGELNVIVVAGIPYNESMIDLQYHICVYAAVGITGSAIIVIVVKMVWWSRVSVLKGMPRRPDTIGSVCSYLCGSDLVQWASELALGEMKEEQIRRVVRDCGKSFRFRRGIGTDGVLRWTVDIAKREESS